MGTNDALQGFSAFAMAQTLQTHPPLCDMHHDGKSWRRITELKTNFAVPLIKDCLGLSIHKTEMSQVCSAGTTEQASDFTPMHKHMQTHYEEPLGLFTKRELRGELCHTDTLRISVPLWLPL